MFRVFDKKNQKWITKNIYMSQDGDLYIFKKTIFSGAKLEPLEEGMYVCHRDIGLCDKNDELIFEGDSLKAEVSDNRIVKGIAVFAHELSSYVLLCDETNEWFSLGSEVCERIEIIGNVFDGYERE